MRLDGEVAKRSQSPTQSLSNGSNGLSPPLAKLKGCQKSSKAESNGSSPTSRRLAQANGVSVPSPMWFGHDRQEVTRLLIQALSGLGYNSSARTLARESGVQLEGETVSSFRNSVLTGDWPEAEALLFGDCDFGGPHLRTGRHRDERRGSWLNGLALTETADKRAMLFWIKQQKYMELIESRDLSGALFVLRNELTPLHGDVAKLHSLSRSAPLLKVSPRLF